MTTPRSVSPDPLELPPYVDYSGFPDTLFVPSMPPARRSTRLTTRGLVAVTFLLSTALLALLTWLLPLPQHATTVHYEDGSTATYVDGVKVASTSNDAACDC